MPLRVIQGLFVALLAALLTAGCASGPKLRQVYGTPPGPIDEMARIYFYRNIDAFMVARETDFVVNGQRVGTAVSGSVFYRDALPGRYRIHTVDDPKHIIYLTLAAGDVSFVRAEVKFSGVAYGIGAVEVERAAASTEVLDLAIIDALNVASMPLPRSETAEMPPEPLCCNDR